MLNEYPFVFRDLSAKVEYALLALIELASVWNQNSPLTVNEISTRQPIPDRYLEHIFTMLRRGGLVKSQRGARGGYVLTREPWQIKVSEVITLVDGDTQSSTNRRNLKVEENLNTASIERDVVQEIWQKANFALQEVLSSYTIQDLCDRRDAQQQKHPMYYI